MSRKITVDIPNKLAVACALAALLVVGRFTCGDELQAETGSAVQRRAGTSTSAGAFAEQLAPGPMVGKMLSPNPADTSVTKWVDPPTGLPTGTTNDVPQIVSTGTNTGWGVTNLAGTTDYIPKKTASGWGDSAMSESGGYMSLAENFAIHNADLATMMIENASDSGLYPRLQTLRQRGTIGSPQPIGAGDYLGLINFLARTSGGYGYSGAYLAAIADNITGGNIVGRMCLNLADGSSADSSAQVWCAYPSYFNIAGGLTVQNLPGKGVGKYLYDTDGNGTIGEKTIAAADVGAEPTLPACAPGQLVAYTGTGTSTTTAKGCVAQSTGAALAFATSTPASVATSGSVGTSSQLVRADHVHAYTGIPVSYYTSTPVAIGTSGAVGTSSQVTRGDHTHQGDGNNKVAAYASQTPQYLTDAMVCTNGTISITGSNGVAVINANLGSTNGTVAAGDDSRFGLVSVASGYSMGYLADRIESTTGSLTAANNLGVLNLNVARSTSTPAAVGTSGSVGTAATSSRSDHVHAEGSGPRTPTAHGSTHNPGGTDVPSAFTNTPGVGKVATLTSAGQNLDGWTTATATPGASVIVKSDASGTVNAWVTAATPSAHGNTHNPGGTDVPSSFTNTPGVGKVATLTSAGQNLDGWTTATATPGTASTIMKAGAAGYGNQWLSLAADPFSSTPGANKVPYLPSGGTLNAWISGMTLRTVTGAALGANWSSTSGQVSLVHSSGTVTTTSACWFVVAAHASCSMSAGTGRMYVAYHDTTDHQFSGGGAIAGPDYAGYVSLNTAASLYLPAGTYYFNQYAGGLAGVMNCNISGNWPYEDVTLTVQVFC